MTTGTFTAAGQASDSFALTTGAGVQLVPDGAASAALQVSIDSGATWSTDAHLGGTERRPGIRSMKCLRQATSMVRRKRWRRAV